MATATCERTKSDGCCTTHTKLTPEGSKDLDVRPDAIELLEVKVFAKPHVQ